MTGAAGLTCKELVELVTEYLEGTLAEGERVRFDAHIAECDGCARYLEQMRYTIAASGQLRAEHVPAPVLTDLLRAFRDWKPGDRR